jgi:hypothetical protein
MRIPFLLTLVTLTVAAVLLTGTPVQAQYGPPGYGRAYGPSAPPAYAFRPAAYYAGGYGGMSNAYAGYYGGPRVYGGMAMPRAYYGGMPAPSYGPRSGYGPAPYIMRGYGPPAGYGPGPMGPRTYGFYR